MRFLDEFADPVLARRLLGAIEAAATRPWSIMEVCGGQTHSIVRHGIDQVLPPGITLLHGPGCPVCVTPVGVVDQAVAVAAHPDVVLCSFGDMVRVPGSAGDLQQVRASGADVRVVYSPLDAVRLAEELPEREVVLFAIGFETTAPATATAVREAARRHLANFSVLVSHVLVPPAIEAVLGPDHRVDGFLAAGHVCTVMGTRPYEALAARHHVPIVATGFEPLDVLEGIRRVVVQLERGEARVENAYPRVVTESGNPHALAAIDEVFDVCDRTWRGIGVIPASGWQLRPGYAAFDAVARFGLATAAGAEHPRCRAGEVLQGRLAPTDCEAFGTECTPRHPLGAPMVSAEGTCAAYHRHRAVPLVVTAPDRSGP